MTKAGALNVLPCEDYLGVSNTPEIPRTRAERENAHMYAHINMHVSIYTHTYTDACTSYMGLSRRH